MKRLRGWVAWFYWSTSLPLYLWHFNSYITEGRQNPLHDKPQGSNGEEINCFALLKFSSIQWRWANKICVAWYKTKRQRKQANRGIKICKFSFISLCHRTFHFLFNGMVLWTRKKNHSTTEVPHSCLKASWQLSMNKSHYLLGPTSSCHLLQPEKEVIFLSVGPLYKPTAEGNCGKIKVLGRDTFSTGLDTHCPCQGAANLKHEELLPCLSTECSKVPIPTTNLSYCTYAFNKK